MNNNTFNFLSKNTYCYTDSYDMVLRKDPYWESNKDGGKADSIGRTFYSYLCYPNNRFVNAIDNCWEKVYYNYSSNPIIKILQKVFRGGDEYYYQGHRHPSHNNLKGLSRDHLMYTIMLYKESDNTASKVSDLTNNIRWKISSFALFTIDSWLWVKAMGGSKTSEILYKLLLFPIIGISILWNKLIYKLGNFGEEMHQKDFFIIQAEDKSKKIKRLAKSLYPVYALLIQALQVYYLNDGILKRGLEKMLLKLTPKHNYVIQLLLRKKGVLNEDVYSYKMMTTGRWSSILEPNINVRDLQIIKDDELNEFNRIEEDLVIKLWKNREEIH